MHAIDIQPKTESCHDDNFIMTTPEVVDMAINGGKVGIVTTLGVQWVVGYQSRICMGSSFAINITGIILGMGSANERGPYTVTSFLIDWAHTQNDHWNCRDVCNIVMKLTLLLKNKQTTVWNVVFHDNIRWATVALTKLSWWKHEWFCGIGLFLSWMISCYFFRIIKPQGIKSLTHRCLVTPYNVINVCQLSSRQLIGVYSAPNHYLNQCWLTMLTVNWTLGNKTSGILI